MNMLEVNHVSKAFGEHKIIRDLSFSVPEHTIYGFIGQNGSGKTTTMKMILGLYSIDSGEISVAGKKVSYGKTDRAIGYLPDVPEFYGYMTPAEYLKLCGELSELDHKTIVERSDKLLELVGLSKDNKKIRGFSRGMKQRLGVAQALLNEPKLLICDEPTSALDPLGRMELLDILKNVREHTTVIFSTHILSDVENICDEIGLLKDGTLALSGTIDEIRSRHGSDGFEIQFQREEDRARFEGRFGSPNQTGRLILFYPGCGEQDMKIALRELLQADIVPARVEMREANLETLFLETVAKGSSS